MNKIALWLSVYVDHWTAESAIIASNDDTMLSLLAFVGSYAYWRETN